MIRTQLNLYLDGNMYGMPDFDGFVPRQGERVSLQGKSCVVEEVTYKFDGAPISLAHINVWLKSTT